MRQTNISSKLISVEGIPIRITRKRIRNVNFRIHDDGSVAMSVPAQISYATAERLARERIDWIRKERSQILEKRKSDTHLWLDGESLKVWGKPHEIAVRQHSAREEAILEEDTLVIYAHPEDAGTEDMALRKRAHLVEALLAREASQAVRELLPSCEARVGRQARSVTVRRMKTRWGSCTVSRGTIRINTALAEHPRPCIEMVLTHELCHLVFANHGPQFLALLDQCYPGWQEVQHYLDENPPRMYPELQA